MDSLLGHFATSKAGHDQGNLYVIVVEEGNLLGLCDGRLKTIDKPKMKKRKHIQLTQKCVSDELLQRLYNKEVVRNEEIKLALKQYNKVAD